MRVAYPNELWHYGVRGMKWGVRRGPPYPIGKYVGKTRRFEATTKDGVKVRLFSEHAQGRAAPLDRQVSDEAIVDALRNPLNGDKLVVRYDAEGRPSKRYIGNSATVNINPDNGIITTVWSTGTKTRKKYTKES